MSKFKSKSQSSSKSLSTKTFALIFFLSLSFSAPLFSAWVIKDGWIADADCVATLSCEDHWALGLQAMESQNWRESAKQFNVVCTNFPNTTMGQDACFFLGVSWMHQN